VLLAGLTGLRWGELRALRVRHIDLLRCRLTVSANLPTRHRATQVVAPKSHERRTVSFPKHLREPLAACINGKRPEDWLFSTGSGQPLDLSNWRRQVFGPAVTSLGLQPLTPHNLRHTAASLAVRAGAPVNVVQRMLGHASAAMTLDVYAGLFANDLDALAERLDDAALSARSHSQGIA
jgi:integrase